MADGAGVRESSVRNGFREALAHRAAWRLLVRGLSTFLPERAAALDLAAVRPVSDTHLPPSPGQPLVFLTEVGGFGLQLSSREGGSAPEREIFVRGRTGQAVGSIGIVIVGSSPRVGTRIVDASSLFRYARGLTFETLYDPADASSVAAAVQAARAVENVVFVDLARGVGLCAELDPGTRRMTCPLFVRFGSRSTVTVHAHVSAFVSG
jgi:hypothetical protein